MKRYPILLLLALTSAPIDHAAENASPPPSDLGLKTASFDDLEPRSPIVSGGSRTLDWHPGRRDTTSTIWEATENPTNGVDGSASTAVHQYVEVATGLNYVNPITGLYEPSEDLIELSPDGTAGALRGPTKLYVQPNLNVHGAITYITERNRVVQTRPLGLFFYDALSGRTQLIAPIQDCVGELFPPNQVIWKDAFGPIADLRLTYTKAGIESDVILRSQIGLPPGWDSASTRIEVWHEWRGLPNPRSTPRFLSGETDPTRRALMADPDFVDNILDFGELWFPTGAAFATDGSDFPPFGTSKTVRVRDFHNNALSPVAKTWFHLTGRDILVEAVPWEAAKAQFGILPIGQISGFQGTEQPTRADLIANLALPRTSSQPGLSIEPASEPYRPTAWILDYTTVPTSGTSYTFQSGTTYYVSGTTYFSGTLTFNSNCIVKFAANQYLLTYGGFSCNGTSGSPSILTSWEDDLFGQQISGSNGDPGYSASQAIWSYYIPSSHSLTGLRIRWAQTGIDFDANGCGSYAHSVSNISLEFCQTGIYENNGYLTLSGSTKCNLTTSVSTVGCGLASGTLTDIGSSDTDGNGRNDSDDLRYFGRTGSLPGHILGQMESLLSGHSRLTDLPIWSTRNDATATYAYNTGNWLYGVSGFTAFSPWHQYITNYADRTKDVPENVSAITLITPRHGVFATHMSAAYNDGTKVRFVGTDNVCHEVVCLHSEGGPLSQGIWDYSVVVFDQDLPTSVETVPLVPYTILQKLTQSMHFEDLDTYSGRLPIVTYNQLEEAYINDVWKFPDAPDYYTPSKVSMWISGWDSSCHYNNWCSCGSLYNVTSGDSSSPSFLLINGQLVLIGPQSNCASPIWHGPNINTVNAHIQNLDTWVSNQSGTNAMTGYTATEYDVSSFPTLW